MRQEQLMPEGIPINAIRADWARKSLMEFEGSLALSNSLEDIITDFLTDLHHLCDSEKIDIQSVLDRSQKHYMTEKEEGEIS